MMQEMPIQLCSQPWMMMMILDDHLLPPTAA
jgi:hypothetical protein